MASNVALMGVAGRDCYTAVKGGIAAITCSMALEFAERLRPFRLPGRTARQLPDQSTILWVASSSTGNSRLRGALLSTDIGATPEGPARSSAIAEFMQ
jgi:hypothetical protein